MRRRRKSNNRPFYVFIIALAIVFSLFFKLARKGIIPQAKKISQRKQVAEQNKRPPSRPKTKKITIALAGDVMFDRRVKAATQANGALWPFAKTASYLKADLTIINLESSLSSKGKPTSGKDVVFQGTPLGGQALKAVGVDIVSLANNHALDYGPASLRQTREILKRKNIAFTGAGANKDEAYQPAIVKVGDMKVGLLSFSDVIPFNSFPTEKSAGIAPARNPSKVAVKIKALAKKVHLVLVAFHWGVEYQDYPTAKQKELAIAAVDAGADLVIGTHPHVTQGVALYKGRLILYSLGNFVFDHYKPNTGESFIFRVEMNSKGEFNFARILPVLISDSGQPSVVTSSEGQKILSRVKTISGKYGSMLEPENGSFVIRPK